MEYVRHFDLVFKIKPSGNTCIPYVINNWSEPYMDVMWIVGDADQNHFADLIMKFKMKCRGELIWGLLVTTLLVLLLRGQSWGMLAFFLMNMLNMFWTVLNIKMTIKHVSKKWIFIRGWKITSTLGLYKNASKLHVVLSVQNLFPRETISWMKTSENWGATLLT